MSVGVLAFNASRQREQHRLRPLQLVGALLKPEKGPNPGEQFGSIDGAAQKIIGSDLDTLDPVLPVRKSRNQNYGDQISIWIVLDFLASLKACEARHHNIH